ncbi:hypothetical protein DRO60_03675 [Candidatus Bathyarchaeota archaeon]|nr:MAG: hypothetical protein DRO60_03675 [Candidatus Bathyarchaeota archaeon]
MRRSNVAYALMAVGVVLLLSALFVDVRTTMTVALVDEVVSLEPAWFSETWPFEEVLLIEEGRTYAVFNLTVEYYGPPEEGGNVTLSFTATETSMPRRPFNLYVLDDADFLLWSLGKEYEPLYEVRGTTECHVELGLEGTYAEELHIVVEEHEEGVKPCVKLEGELAHVLRNPGSVCVLSLGYASQEGVIPTCINFKSYEGVIHVEARALGPGELDLYVLESPEEAYDISRGLPSRAAYGVRGVGEVSADIPCRIYVLALPFMPSFYIISPGFIAIQNVSGEKLCVKVFASASYTTRNLAINMALGIAGATMLIIGLAIFLLARGKAAA